MHIERLLAQAKGQPESDVLGMVLANHIDMGCDTGGLISLKAYPTLIQDIQRWRIWSDGQLAKQQAVASPENEDTPTAWYVSGPTLYRTVYLRGDIEPAVLEMVEQDPASDSDDYTATGLYLRPYKGSPRA